MLHVRATTAATTYDCDYEYERLRVRVRVRLRLRATYWKHVSPLSLLCLTVRLCRDCIHILDSTLVFSHPRIFTQEPP